MDIEGYKSMEFVDYHDSFEIEGYEIGIIVGVYTINMANHTKRN